jgi:hypothetical protein
MIYLLLDKLKSYGMKHKSNLWFKLYLPHWLEFVEMKEIDYSNSFKNSYTLSCMKLKHVVCVCARAARLCFGVTSVFAIYK